MKHRLFRLAKIDRGLEWGSVSDFGAAAQLIQLSWSANPDVTLNYDHRFLQSCLQYPGTEPALAPAIYHKQILVAFVIGMPRRVLLENQPRKLLLMTLFTVAPEWKGRGLGVAVWAECLRRAQDVGYDGSIHFCAEGNISNHATLAGARAAGHEARHILTVRYLMRLLKSVPAYRALSEQPSDEHFAIAARSTMPVPLKRLWTRAEVEWQCRRRVDPICVTCETETSCGALAGYRICSLNSGRTAYSLVDDTLWHHLNAKERESLLELFLRLAAETAQVAVVPLLGYADMSPFLKYGFRRSPRILHAYLTMWDGSAVSEMQGMYLDVL